MQQIRSETKGVALVALSAFGWSTAGLFTRLVAAQAWAIVGWRGVFTGLAVLVFLVWKERGGVVRSFAALGATGLLAATISTLASIAYISSLLFTSVANVVVIYATMPFVTAGLAWVLMRERPSSSTLLAAGAALAGVLVMVGGGGARGAIAGVALALAMTVGMGLLTVISRRARGISMVPATCFSGVQLAVIGAFATPLLAVPPHDIAVLAAFGVVQAAAFACYLEGARHLAASRSALLSTLDVPLAPLWVFVAVGETPARSTVVGGTIVLAAVLWDIAAHWPKEPASA